MFHMISFLMIESPKGQSERKACMTSTRGIG